MLGPLLGEERSNSQIVDEVQVAMAKTRIGQSVRATSAVVYE